MLAFTSALVFGLLIGSVRSQSCEDTCTPADGEDDCCDYVTDVEVYEYCESEVEDLTYFENCEVESDNSTNSSSNVFGCNLGWDVDFVGKSGQFKLFPCDDSNFFIKVNLQLIQEYDSSGQKNNAHKVTAFSYASAVYGSYSATNNSVYSWTDADGNDKTLGGVELDYVFDVDGTEVTFLMNLYLIDDVTIITYTNTYGNVTYKEVLSQGTLKFDYTIEGWPFENDDDQLGIEVRMTTGGTTNDGSSDGSSNGKSSFSWGDDFVVDLPETYQHTDTNDDETGRDAVIDFDPNSSGKSVDVTFTFENAGDSTKLMYDPSVSSSKSESGGNKAISIQFAAIACLLLAIVNSF